MAQKQIQKYGGSNPLTSSTNGRKLAPLAAAPISSSTRTDEKDEISEYLAQLSKITAEGNHPQRKLAPIAVNSKYIKTAPPKQEDTGDSSSSYDISSSDESAAEVVAKTKVPTKSVPPITQPRSNSNSTNTNNTFHSSPLKNQITTASPVTSPALLKGTPKQQGFFTMGNVKTLADLDFDDSVTESSIVEDIMGETESGSRAKQSLAPVVERQSEYEDDFETADEDNEEDLSVSTTVKKILEEESSTEVKKILEEESSVAPKLEASTEVKKTSTSGAESVFKQNVSSKEQGLPMGMMKVLAGASIDHRPSIDTVIETVGPVIDTPIDSPQDSLPDTPKDEDKEEGRRSTVRFAQDKISNNVTEVKDLKIKDKVNSTNVISTDIIKAEVKSAVSQASKTNTDVNSFVSQTSNSNTDVKINVSPTDALSLLLPKRIFLEHKAVQCDIMSVESSGPIDRLYKV